MNKHLKSDALDPERTWNARLEFGLRKKSDKTTLCRYRHLGPLYVQKPFYPEGDEYPHVYLLHPPGGIVSGDNLEISVDVGESSGGLLTTPGASRIYRAREEQPTQCQSITLNIRKDAILEWFPMETIVFNHANVSLKTTIDIVGGSKFIGWEICCFGLPAREERFNNGKFCQQYLLRRNGLPVFVDRLNLGDDPTEFLQGNAGMRGNSVFGFFLFGPKFTKEDSFLEALRATVKDNKYEKVASVSKVGDFYIGRYLGHSAEQAKNIFINWWFILRPHLINREACLPRIWST